MVPVSTALTNVFCAAFALLLLVSPEFWRNLPTVVRHRAALAALLLLAALAASVAYSVAPPTEAWGWVGKYLKLLLVPLGIVAFRGSQWDPIVRRAWFGTLCVILLLSTTNYLGLTAIGPAHASTLPLSRAWVFKNHIAAGIFDALLFYQAADLAFSATTRRARLIYIGIALLTLANEFVMLQGRTGQIISIVFVAFWSVRVVWHECGKSRARAIAAISASLAVLAVIGGCMAALHGGRMQQVMTEVHDYRQTDAVTSTGLRLEWYRKSLHLIAARPLFGYGAGGLRIEFEQMTAGKTAAEGQLTSNPHNEYLLMTVQLGLVGLALFVNLLVQAGRYACALPERSRSLLLAWLAAFVIGCLANSLLLDFAEGHLFVLLAGILLGCGYRGAGGGARYSRAA